VQWELEMAKIKVLVISSLWGAFKCAAPQLKIEQYSLVSKDMIFNVIRLCRATYMQREGLVLSLLAEDKNGPRPKKAAYDIICKHIIVKHVFL
jgi:hypothetical protein